MGIGKKNRKKIKEEAKASAAQRAAQRALVAGEEATATMMEEEATTTMEAEANSLKYITTKEPLEGEINFWWQEDLTNPRFIVCSDSPIGLFLVVTCVAWAETVLENVWHNIGLEYFCHAWGSGWSDEETDVKRAELWARRAAIKEAGKLMNRFTQAFSGEEDADLHVTDLSKCDFCGKEGVFKTMLYCKNCEQCLYCSKECSDKHWKSHIDDCPFEKRGLPGIGLLKNPDHILLFGRSFGCLDHVHWDNLNGSSQRSILNLLFKSGWRIQETGSDNSGDTQQAQK